MKILTKNFFFQLHGSNSTHVLLYRLELESEGLYSCEVSTFPSFITAIAFKQMKVICKFLVLVIFRSTRAFSGRPLQV